MRTMLAISALCLVVETADAQDTGRIIAERVGRYQIVANATDTFLLDTATGFVWVLKQHTDFNKDPLAWEPMFLLTKPSDTTPLLSEYGLKPKR